MGRRPTRVAHRAACIAHERKQSGNILSSVHFSHPPRFRKRPQNYKNSRQGRTDVKAHTTKRSKTDSAGTPTLIFNDSLRAVNVTLFQAFLDKYIPFLRTRRPTQLLYTYDTKLSRQYSLALVHLCDPKTDLEGTRTHFACARYTRERHGSQNVTCAVAPPPSRRLPRTQPARKSPPGP